ncbi:MAG: diaminopimelate decarboxylase, partial [Candidatus Methanomethylicia archaeon]
MVHNDRFWSYIENLMGRGVDFNDLVKIYGTPLYFIDAEMVKHNYKILKGHLDKVISNNMICYAYKANTCLALLKVLKDLGAGAEVVSGGELYAAKLVGLSSDKIVFDGVSKNPNE